MKPYWAEIFSSEKKQSKRDLFGHLVVGFLVCICLLSLAVQIYQTDFWAQYFFKDTIRFGTNCTYAVGYPENPDQPLPLTPQKTVRLPHTGKVLHEQRNGKPFVQIRYRCQVDMESVPKNKGITNLYFAYIYGDHSTISINGQERLSSAGPGLAILPITREELHAPSIEVTVDVMSANTRYIGLVSRPPLSIAPGDNSSLTIYSIYAFETKVRGLYSLLPVLTMSVFLILGWFSRIRSRLMVSTLFYFSFVAAKNWMFFSSDLLPFDYNSFYAYNIAIGNFALIALSILALEILQVGVRWIRSLYAMTMLAMLLEFGVIYFDPYQSLTGELNRWHGYFHLASVFVITFIYLRKNKQHLPLDRLQINYVFVGGYLASGLAVIVDRIRAFYPEFQFDALAKIEMYMPLFIGGIVLYTLAQIEKSYRVEKSKNDKMERDLEVAHEIQDSLAPPPQAVEFEEFRFYFFQKKNDQVAGDWMNFRTDQNGEKAYIVLTDVTGKGLQAALVVHAIQSLWAENLDLEFNPTDWIQKVNRTLFKLGKKKPHSSTLGLIELTKDSITYYCQGHLPVFVRLNQKITSLYKPSPSLGIHPVLDVEGVSRHFDTGLDEIEIVLSSDGVIEHGAAVSKRELKQLFEAIQKDGQSVVAQSTIADDRTLIFIEKIKKWVA